jgi:ribulose-bisphosphate carboxylase small chain
MIMAFRLTQGTFSFLPDLTDEQITLQVEYMLQNNWAVSIEFTDDPHPKNFLWDMWGLPMFDLKDPAGVLAEIRACRESYPDQYIRVNAYDAAYGRQTTAISFLVNRPSEESAFTLDRQFAQDRIVRYSVQTTKAAE